jgi:hypothetical protein
VTLNVVVESFPVQTLESSEQVVNSLECSGPALLWSAATGRRIVNQLKQAWPQQVATD